MPKRSSRAAGVLAASVAVVGGGRGPAECLLVEFVAPGIYRRPAVDG